MLCAVDSGLGLYGDVGREEDVAGVKCCTKWTQAKENLAGLCVCRLESGGYQPRTVPDGEGNWEDGEPGYTTVKQNDTLP